MIRIIRIIFLLTIVALFSCEEKGFVTDCEECTDYEPVEAIVKIKIDENYISGVVVKIWEGKIEDQILFDSATVYQASYKRFVSINKTYTITATYLINNREYTTIDSATPRVRYTEDMCERPCYHIYDRSYDLRLKYTK